METFTLIAWLAGASRELPGLSRAECEALAAEAKTYNATATCVRQPCDGCRCYTICGWGVPPCWEACGVPDR